MGRRAEDFSLVGKVAESPNYGGTINALTSDAAGNAAGYYQKVQKLNKSI